MLPMEVERRLRFVAVFLGSSLHGKPKARVYRLTWRVGPEPQWEGENKSRGAPAGRSYQYWPRVLRRKVKCKAPLEYAETGRSITLTFLRSNRLWLRVRERGAASSW